MDEMYYRLETAMKLKTAVIALLLGLVITPALAGSTVNPNVPAYQSDLTSAPLRGNFAAAYNDVNNLLGEYPGTVAPVNPLAGQLWRNTSTSPQIVYQWTGTTWAQY